MEKQIEKTIAKMQKEYDKDNTKTWILGTIESLKGQLELVRSQ